jgi:DNA-binding GntR family transcriptional regulator
VGQPKINAIEHSPVGQSVYRALQGLLARHRFVPGQKLNVEALARDLGVSRTPVWEALKKLEVEGVVRTRPRKGVYVTALDANKAREIYVVREVVEGLAARLAAGHITAAELRKLEGGLDIQAAAVAAGDVPAYSRADIEFHNTIVQASRNDTLIRILGSLYGQILVLRLQTLNLKDRMRPSVQEHQRIFAALKSGDPDRAEAAARHHIRMVLRDALAVLPGQAAPAPGPRRSGPSGVERHPAGAGAPRGGTRGH